MTYDMLLLRFGELILKGKNRRRFEKSIFLHVKSVLSPFPLVQLRNEFGRIYVYLNGEPASEAIQALKKVFGIASISPVIVCKSDLEDILRTSHQYLQDMNIQNDTTFKVSARRVWKKFPHSSHEMNHLVGSHLLKEFQMLNVMMNHPELELRVEIRETETYIFYVVIPAVGGFPRGSNGKAMLLLSGGIDSPVAAWSSMRKGLTIECVHFYSYPFTSQLAKDKVEDLARVLSGYAGEIKLHFVPFTETQTSFTGMGQDKLIITLMRRAMLRIATTLAEREGALAIVTGDSLGQVASQTLPSLNVVGRATDLPILRPLIMMDKNEIIQISRDIGTYELSIQPYEDCCTLFVADSPATNPNLRIVERLEQSIVKLPELLQDAVERTETVVLTPTNGGRLSTEKLIQEDWF
ncbi:tRNA uracil 4-sulfurtransferase ThiI [Paenibacillus crassostreae]|uniref:Probable tRNA sulfurtransferase n=1 Tax=Paenibacillus crassostreae TaxID=1763538 RepID=A0A167C899_9BACL|nr:tRNA uracil 4-sulfurtransferase ThiI [Paenibacillus crassostreae]AOZ94583.1 tRNA 4-thiouridine(8) synthase ThiI [Paenibacillus crassostreae]OAB72905.1 thiamine biosynthesis protein ThiI [Paenibacillus crassostreae]